MFAKYEVRFNGSVPTEEVVLNTLRTSTTIETLLTTRQEYGDMMIINPFDETDGCEFYVDCDSYFVEGYTPSYKYLTASLLYVLVGLGGKYDYHIPEWASLSWEDAQPFIPRDET